MTQILVKRRASLGDVLNTTPIVHRLRREYPSALIWVETLHAAAYRRNPHTDVVSPPFDGEFDRIIDLDLCFESNRRIHQVDANMLRAFGDTEGDKTIILKHNPINFISEINWSKVIVVHANATWAQRTLPIQWWNEVLIALNLDGWITVLTGTESDLPVTEGLVDLRGKLSLASQANLIDRAKVFLSGSSGLVTVAGSTETPIVCMVSMTPWENWAPYRHEEIGWNTWPIRTPLTCYGCDVDEPAVEYYPCKYGHNACMQSFDVERVVETVRVAAREDRRGEFK